MARTSEIRRVLATQCAKPVYRNPRRAPRRSDRWCWSAGRRTRRDPCAPGASRLRLPPARRRGCSPDAAASWAGPWRGLEATLRRINHVASVMPLNWPNPHRGQRLRNHVGGAGAEHQAGLVERRPCAGTVAYLCAGEQSTPVAPGLNRVEFLSSSFSGFRKSKCHCARLGLRRWRRSSGHAGRCRSDSGVLLHGLRAGRRVRRRGRCPQRADSGPRTPPRRARW